VLYAGLMLCADGPKVLEFNARFGDPETQVLMPRLKGDLLPALLAAASGTLEETHLEWRRESCVTVVAAAQGYPGRYETGQPIAGISEAETLDGVAVFHAGTRLEGRQAVTVGGRVLAISALGADGSQAAERAYHALERIRFDGMVFRTDIGRDTAAARR
jgi:phosphoribosylamine--glycine ligase